VIDGVQEGHIERGVGSCAAQLYNVLARYIELERRQGEVALEERLEGLEGRLEELAEAGARWGT
jgi:hypothetical protein